MGRVPALQELDPPARQSVVACAVEDPFQVAGARRSWFHPVVDVDPCRRRARLGENRHLVAAVAHRYALCAVEGGEVAASSLTGVAGFASPTLHSLAARLSGALSRRPFGLVVANVPGPQRVRTADGASMNDHVGDVAAAIALWDADVERGLPEMPFPPDYPKMPGEPPRVQPSKKVAAHWDEAGNRIAD